MQALEWANRYGGICRIALAFQHILIVSDPEVAAKVLARGPGSVPRKSIGYAFFDLVRRVLGRSCRRRAGLLAGWAAWRR